MNRALLLVDIQNDFMPFGSLPVKDGDAVVPVANAAASEFEFVIATQDWHPPDHGSFASAHEGRSPGELIMLDGVEQVLWPDHCIQNTPGASLHSGLDVSRIDRVVRKGTDRRIDSYSAFFDNRHKKDTGLGDVLRDASVREVWIVGLATDYCVLFTALDGRALGFEVVVLGEGVRAVDNAPGDGDRALVHMAEAGCRVIPGR